MQKEDIYNKIRYPNNRKIGDELIKGDVLRIREILRKRDIQVDLGRIRKILKGTRPDSIGVIEIAKQILEQNKAFE